MSEASCRKCGVTNDYPGLVRRVELEVSERQRERLEEALREWDSIGNEVRNALDLGLGAMRDRERDTTPKPTTRWCRQIDDALRAARGAHAESSASLAEGGRGG